MLTMDEIVRAASISIDDYRARVAHIPYERKGILYSEMFFFKLCASAVRPKRILESGRARGQSALLMALSFPNLPIISIEHDPKSPDVTVAEQRLRNFNNVELKFGDATRLLPEIAQPGDITIIDGPKGFLALRLALTLLAQGRTRMIFLHDVGKGTAERKFMEKYLPSTLYSDDPRFVELAYKLDISAVDSIPFGRRWEPDGAPLGYGFTLACLQWRPDENYRRLWWAAVLTGLARRAGL